jgi:PAS domain S-box-containing protein
MRPLPGKGPEAAGAEDVLGEPEDFDSVLGVLVENAPVAMALFDSRMRYVLANRQWINDFGLQQSLPLVGCSQYDVFPNLHPGWRSVYERALQGHVVRSEHDVMPGPHGRAMVFRWEVRPWRRSKDNSVGGVMVTCEKFAALSPMAGSEASESGPSQPTLLESDIPILITNVQGLCGRSRPRPVASRSAGCSGEGFGSRQFDRAQFDAAAPGPGITCFYY